LNKHSFIFVHKMKGWDGARAPTTTSGVQYHVS